jgi:A/G-specific adenine glycosylase
VDFAESGGFSGDLLVWFDCHGRHDLPWQQPRSPYFVWLSEVMLQQTQVTTVIGYFNRFVARFASLEALAQAQLDEVLALWAGLGYYTRARNLHRCAKICVAEHGASLPASFDALIALPGIGRSTAGAILAQAFAQKAAILDGNVRRVLVRQLALSEWPGLPHVERQLWQHAHALLPEVRISDYTQAQMDLGALVCTARRPSCAICPVQKSCLAFAQGKTHELPVRRPKKTRPLRACHWLLAQDADARILLIRRPERGIWGGLYCLPEVEDVQDFQALVLPGQNYRFGALAPLAEVRHEFSHFTLTAQVHRAQALETDFPPFVGVRDGGVLPPSGLPSGTREISHTNGTYLWADATVLKTLGMPAPVKKLLQAQR